ncbi:EscU/YscU/HrcU family type III secretion system export apparatus switch protein [Caldicellulosiruptor morganii]|uniref:EscU/YscU/HrcU family type III secretion system export apparatus switch protein n=1 Tax=Caldicellulosiruptor morganii TaxID=1387555 RepID=A0ABY7BQX0_9FIRM|nr:EscU/YscU/HrcU family type III secretion system export apparatus switch protein [Caldicellulosiruptor morganii]WAM34732.1 EscU/YscU/HrcU family type III secretion system export apparatus switch protein [Caldicellulosiruptor morganii]
MSERKRKKAVAIKYDMSEIAPRLVAKGQGLVAERILKKAKQEGIPVYHDGDVAEKLFNLELQQYIPEDLYEVVAQILVYIGYLDKINQSGDRAYEQKRTGK